jgi:hypothetical protein
MSQSHIRIPPDGTGKMLAAGCYLDIDYNNLTGDIQLGDVVTGSVSGLLGEVVKVVPVDAVSGAVYVKIYHEAPEAVVNVETLTFVGITPPGTATVIGTGTPLYVSRTQIMGDNNPLYGQHVDVKGAASVRFSEGSPLFDAFGGQKVSDPSTIGVYEFSSDGGFDLFSTVITGSATEEYNPVTSTVDMTCSAASGDSVIRTSNKCHYYWPGNGTTIIMSAALSDTGVVGNTRRIGFFDENDGIYFEMKDTMVYVCLRSSTLGTTQRVPQADWNVDKLDGTGLSGVNITWNKAIVYFIDLQWLGAGKVRLGIIGPDGSRVVIHEFQNSGKNTYPYMKSGSLPVRAENFNTAATGTITQLRLTCLVVKCDGLIDYTYYRNSALHPSKVITGDNMPLISIRAKTLYGGRRNPVNSYPEEYNCYVSGGTVRLDFYWPTTLVGDTWASTIANNTAMEIDTAATAAIPDADSWLYFSHFADAGAHSFNLRNFFNNNDEGIITNADGTPSYPWIIVASKIDGSPVVNSGSLSWKELR